MWWTKRCAAAACAALALLALTVCATLPTAQPRFVFSGNDLGFIRPCGCSKPVLGGIARRAGMLHLLRQEGPLVPLSTGNLVAESGVQQQVKLEHMLFAMNAMGYKALAPGVGEFGLGLDYLRGIASLADFPFVCLNATQAGEPVFARSVALEGTAWRVTGLVPTDMNCADVVVEDPVAALGAFAASLDAGTELVVLWNGPEEMVEKLEQALPAARRARTVIAVACVGDAPRPIAGAASMAVAVGSKGRDLLLLQADAVPYWRSIRLEESVVLDAECARILEAYRDVVRGENLVSGNPRSSSAAYSGGASCRECHEDCTTALAASGHMRAMQTLERTRDERDPECVRCHVVGYDDSEGWTLEKPALANVDCEACHGPSEAHAQTQSVTPVSKPAPRSCLRCHDMDNSPNFDFDTYWPKIRHGK